MSKLLRGLRQIISYMCSEGMLMYLKKYLKEISKIRSSKVDIFHCKNENLLRMGMNPL